MGLPHPRTMRQIPSVFPHHPPPWNVSWLPESPKRMWLLHPLYQRPSVYLHHGTYSALSHSRSSLGLSYSSSQMTSVIISSPRWELQEEVCFIYSCLNALRTSGFPHNKHFGKKFLNAVLMMVMSTDWLPSNPDCRSQAVWLGLFPQVQRGGNTGSLMYISSTLLDSQDIVTGCELPLVRAQ